MSPAVKITAFSSAAVAFAAAAILIPRRFRKTPEARERKRRLGVNLHGRLGDAMVTEATSDALYFSYCIHGVQYAASQDITALRDRLPGDPESLIGPAGLKYVSNNPGNSILICEEWSGLRAHRRGQAQTGS